jgi:hypothetical protein
MVDGVRLPPLQVLSSALKGRIASAYAKASADKHKIINIFSLNNLPCEVLT